MRGGKSLLTRVAWPPISKELLSNSLQTPAKPPHARENAAEPTPPQKTHRVAPRHVALPLLDGRLEVADRRLALNVYHRALGVPLTEDEDLHHLRKARLALLRGSVYGQRDTTGNGPLA